MESPPGLTDAPWLGPPDCRPDHLGKVVTTQILAQRPGASSGQVAMAHGDVRYSLACPIPLADACGSAGVERRPLVRREPLVDSPAHPVGVRTSNIPFGVVTVDVSHGEHIR